MNFKELRVNAGLRQVDAAKRLRVHQTSISAWENGRVNPMRKVRKKLAAVYGVEVDVIEAACMENEERRAIDA